MRCTLDRAKCGAFASFDCVDPIGGSLSQTGKYVLDSVGAVAVPAQVGEENLAPSWAVNRFEQIASRPIGKVAMPSTDALLDGPRAFFVPLEQLRAVVGFDDERINISNALGNTDWRKPKIG